MSAMNIYAIYKVTNIITGKVYIGFTYRWNKRKQEHKRDSKNKNTKLYKSIRKHGWNNFTWQIIYQSLDFEHCKNFMETYFITEHDSFKNGYNETMGGEGTIGFTYVASKSQKEKIRQSKLGVKRKPFTDEWKRKLGDISRGKKRKPFTNEHLKNMSISQKGNTHAKGSIRPDLNLKTISCLHCKKQYSNGQFANHLKSFSYNP